MRRHTLPLAVGLALVAAATPALACSCGKPDPKRAVAQSDLVFDGKVLSQRIGTDLAGKPAAVIRVQVSRMIKGKMPPSGMVTLHSAPHPMSCGVDYSGGFTGRFGVRMHTGGLYTSSCTQFELNLDRYRR